ncbi:MAG: tetratricopeptide repeat protein [Phototrophicaceae bacterium]
MAKFVQRTVYLSYRHPLNQWQARTITLVLEKYGFNVLRSEANMDEQTVLKQIEARAHFILLLAPDSFRQIEQRTDRFRKEIDHAIQKKRNITILFLEGFTLTPKGQWERVGKLRQLSQMKSWVVPNNYIKESVLALVSASYLLQPTEVKVVEPPKRFQVYAETARADNTIVPAETDGMTALDHYYRGLSFSEFGNHEDAIEAYTHAIELDPKFDDAIYDRGFAYGLLGDFAHAVEDYTFALSLNPDEANTYYNRAYAYEQLKHLEQALADYRRVLEFTPQDQDAQEAVKRLSVVDVAEPSAPVIEPPSVKLDAVETELEEPFIHAEEEAEESQPSLVVQEEETEEPFLQTEEPQPSPLEEDVETEAPFAHSEEVVLAPVPVMVEEVPPAPQLAQSLEAMPLTLAELNHQLEATPADPDLLHQRAMLYEAQSDYLKGFNDIFHALSQDPNNPRYLYTRALLCKGLGLFEQSIADLNFVRRVSPQLIQQVEFKFLNQSSDETA